MTFQYLNKPTFFLPCKAHAGIRKQCVESILVKHMVALENVQRRAKRQIPCMNHSEYPEKLHILKLPTLAYRRTREDIIELRKLCIICTIITALDCSDPSLVLITSEKQEGTVSNYFMNIPDSTSVTAAKKAGTFFSLVLFSHHA